MTAAVWLQHVRESSFPLAAPDDEVLYLKSGSAARHAVVAYQSLAADVYWIRAIQLFGGTRRIVSNEASGGGASTNVESVRRRYDVLYPLLDLTTTLDPLFNIAYRFGAIFLAEPYPGGPDRPDLAVALLEKGLRERPNKWEYMQDIGFVHYWWRHDYDAAALWFKRASEVPGAPWWLRSLAATTLAQGGDRQSSRLMWESIRESAEIEWLRREAEKRLMQLSVLDFMDGLQQTVDAFTTRTGRPPSAWSELVRARVIPGIPVDPTRVPYELDANGRVRLSRRSPLFPLPAEPVRRPRS
jgi:hypothetical protein